MRDQKHPKGSRPTFLEMFLRGGVNGRCFNWVYFICLKTSRRLSLSKAEAVESEGRYNFDKRSLRYSLFPVNDGKQHHKRAARSIITLRGDRAAVRGDDELRQR